MDNYNCYGTDEVNALLVFLSNYVNFILHGMTLAGKIPRSLISYLLFLI